MSTSKQNPLTQLALRYLFLVWGSPDQGPRSRIMAGKLGIPVHFIATNLPRGGLYVPIKYPIQAVRTLKLLFRQRPEVIFVQNPPILAVFFVYLYCALSGTRFIIDAHSEALLTTGSTAPPAWFKRFLFKRAVTTLVTNEHLAEMIEALGAKAFILRDVPTTFAGSGRYPVNGNFNVALINTFASDEPLGQVLAAAAGLPDVHFYVTGKINPHRRSKFVDNSPANVHFTDFLANDDYYGLLNTAQAVMCLTTRNHTMQRGACEAASIGKPIITSDWPILRLYFNKGTIHVDNTADGIRRGVLEMQRHLPDFERGIKALQLDQQHEWQQKINLLAGMLRH
jgi:glycosyltransferase involved in cell wall biosynthesis